MDKPFPSARWPVSNCPVCRSTRLHYVFSVSGHRVVRCDDCGLLMANPQPSDDELARIYGEDYFLVEKNEVGQRHVDELKQATADLYLDLLERYRGRAEGTLLEIGCGQGDFLVRAAARGLTVTGIEYSKHACEVARSKLRDAPNSAVLCGEINSATGQYDICACSDLIEHVRNPRLFLEQVHKLLRPNGIVFIATPTLDSWSARLLRNHWMEFKAEHLFYFKASTLQTLLIDCGFEKIIETPGVKTLSVDYIAGHFKRHPVRGVSRAVSVARRVLPRSLRRKALRVVASGMVLMAHKQEKQRPHHRLSVVLPVYNEAPTFETAVERLLRKEMAGIEIEIIIVESNSTDGSREQVLKYRQHPRVKVVLEDSPRGKGHAVRTGLEHVTGDFVMIQDADLEYDLEDYEALLEPLVFGRAAFVLGARHGGSAWKMRQFNDQPIVAAVLNLAHWFFTAMINVAFGARLKDPFTMYKVFRRDCLYGLRFECNRFDFDWEIVINFLRKGYRPLEIPVNYRSRSFAEGKKVSLFRDPITWFRVFIKLRLSRFDPLGEVERQRREKLEEAGAPRDVEPAQ
jgi:glycosyltransferase involved in cell wall biosynthesis/protein-L-isoaspartate O-methyltransferase